MEYSESQEMYLKAIYQLSLATNKVRKIDIAKELGLSKSSVTNAISKLILTGMVKMDDNNNIVLTEQTLEHAKQLYTRYTTFYKLLVSQGISQDKAKDIACKLEHAVDDEVFELIAKKTKPTDNSTLSEQRI